MRTIFTLDEIKGKVSIIVPNYEIKQLYLFGSYARGNANENSDLDFYIGKGEVLGIFQYCGLIDDLEETFGCHVDVLSGEIGDKDLYKNILKDMIIVYEEQEQYTLVQKDIHQ